VGFSSRKRAAKIKGSKLKERRKEMQGWYTDVPQDVLHCLCAEPPACWHLSHCDRSQDTGRLRSATVWLFTRLFVEIRKKKVRSGGLLLEPGTVV